MKLYEVSVIDSVLRRARNARVFVQMYVTMAETPVDAARNVCRDRTVAPNDKLVVRVVEDLTVSVGVRYFYPKQLETPSRFPGEVFVREDLDA